MRTLYGGMAWAMGCLCGACLLLALTLAVPSAAWAEEELGEASLATAACSSPNTVTCTTTTDGGACTTTCNGSVCDTADTACVCRFMNNGCTCGYKPNGS